jgi:hypothetical protein
MDDILIIYDSMINPDSILQYIKIIHSNIQLHPTHETDNSINFLDLSITRKATHLSINIYRKPTTTDNTIHFLSNKNWQLTVSLSEECCPSHLTPISNKKNGNTYYTSLKATVSPRTYCFI